MSESVPSPDPALPAADRDAKVRWLAFLYLAGGAFALAAVAFLPLPASADRLGSALTGTAGILLGTLLLVGRRWIPERAIPAALTVGTLVISAGIYWWGNSPTDDAMFYVWIVVYAAYFFPGRLTLLQLGLVGAAYAAVVALQGAGEEASTRWAVTMTTLAVTAAVVSRLVRALRMAAEGQEQAASEREQLMSRLEEAALTDELTGLPNRRAWDEHFARELNRTRRNDGRVCVAVLDLDHFKAYNDANGHRAGDRLLREASLAWRSQLRGGDVLARYGGEEFALLLPGCSADDAGALIERLRAATPTARTVSAGIAAWNGLEAPDDLIDRADAALYEAKARGRNRAVLAPSPAPAAA
jgi:diguanylate cyclase (GGDEF)-like protein